MWKKQIGYNYILNQGKQTETPLGKRIGIRTAVVLHLVKRINPNKVTGVKLFFDNF